MILQLPDATQAVQPHYEVDNTDWLKTAAIILVVIDHTGYFFIEDADWWSAFGRLAAPPFFFLLGYAKSRTIPLHWFWMAAILTLLDSWNNDWTWVAPNILLSFALIRMARPYVQSYMQKHAWLTFLILIAVLVALLPISAEFVDYGAEGWLWALFGLSHSMYVDNKLVTDSNSKSDRLTASPYAMPQKFGLINLLACIVAAGVYIWQEQIEYSFSQSQFVVFIVGVGVLSLSLGFFRRGVSCLQPPAPIVGILRFIGRHTLEIYAIQLAGSELVILLMPDLAA